MAAATDQNDFQRANFRLCRLCVWPNYNGLGFNLENSNPPPHLIRTVESNSPAVAGGLKILDVILAVNNQDVSQADYRTVTQAIKTARDNRDRIELLVIEKRFYEAFKRKGLVFAPQFARTVDTPSVMPREYASFPKYTPRTCEIRLNSSEEPFGFEVVNGPRDIGASIQEVLPNAPAGQTALRKSDRILEIDDKFVDNEPSTTVFDRIGRAKKNRAIKLYVVDTNTYKHFYERRIPLPSKEYRKSTFARQNLAQPTSTYINVEDINHETGTPDMEVPPTTFPVPVLRDIQQSQLTDSLTTRESSQDDIRLCTITRANATDTYGIELNYHKRDRYHTLKLALGRDNTPSNAALAGVQSNDHLIEINGENIENIEDDQVKQRIRAIKYPQPLQLLVADDTTYNHYKQQNKVIHSGLPSVRKLPATIADQSFSSVSSRIESTTQIRSTVKSLPINEPSIGVAGLVINSLVQPNVSTQLSDATRRHYQLQRVPNFAGYGFSVNSNQGGITAHKITQIAANSPAAQQGLRVGDFILTVNNQDVTQMNAADFNQFLRTSAQNADAQGHPLILDVVNEDSYQPPSMIDDSYTRYDTSLPNAQMNGGVTRTPSQYEATARRSSQDQSRKSIATQPTISRDGSQRIPTTQGLNLSDEPQKLPSTRPTISRDASQKSSAVQSPPYQNVDHKSASNRPYTNGHSSPPHDQYFKPNQTVSSLSIYRSRENLTRGTIDVVSRNRLLRYCRLFAGPSQAFGFQLKANEDRHIIYNIQPESPAARAGLSENDRLIEVDDENVEEKSSREVAILIRNAAHNGRLRVLIIPNSVKVLSKRSAKSLTSLNDPSYYRTSTVRSKYDDYSPASTTGKHRSILHLHGEQNYRDRSSISNYFSEPSEPLPRKCVLQHDPSFRGCGFRLSEKENYDTPIIIDVSPNSPAKRGGLAEGDHIIYIDSQNVQNFHSFDDIIRLIQRSFEENGQVTLITLTGPGYQVLQKRGGYLDTKAFDYQSSHIEQLKPRLCKLRLSNYDDDFGFTLQRHDSISIKTIEKDSPADIYGLRRDDIILELNGRITRNLTIEQIKQIIEASKQEQKLELLVIDPNGYRFSVRHAIPLNSLLSFVQNREGQITMSNHRHSHEPVYL